MQGAGKRRSKGRRIEEKRGGGQQVMSLASPDQLPFAIRLETSLFFFDIQRASPADVDKSASGCKVCMVNAPEIT